MKNLLAYTPETFDNLELENFEYAPLAGEMDMEEGFVRGKQSRPRTARVKTMPRRSIASVLKKPSRIPRLPQIPPRQPMRPLLPPRIGAAASVNVFPPADDRRRPSGQSSSNGNAGGEGNFGNAPAQDVSSEHVRWVQETLNRALGLRLMVDGIMNRETRSAVRMFQERKGLPVTGLVGPDTEEALRAEGGQVAAEPELLEGEWEMEAFVFEAEEEFGDTWKIAELAVAAHCKCRKCGGNLVHSPKKVVDVSCIKCGWEAQVKSIYIKKWSESTDFPVNIKILRGGSIAAIDEYNKKRGYSKYLSPPIFIVLHNKVNMKAMSEMVKMKIYYIEQGYSGVVPTKYDFDILKSEKKFIQQVVMSNVLGKKTFSLIN